jgi:HEPN domain-containing protein
MSLRQRQKIQALPRRSSCGVIRVTDEEKGKIEEAVLYWKESAERDFVTMNNLMVSKDYHWALFIGHLVIEKYLKALFVKHQQEQVLFSHDLLRLARKANLELLENQEDWLDTITSFNINARYDNYKQQFYRLCTREFAEKWVARIGELRKWLIHQLSI